MEVTLLGPLSVEVDGVELSLGGLKQRAVFALLALNAGRVVPLDRLVDELWRDEPPARATLSLQSYVSRLRRALDGQAEIVTRPPGWLLSLDPAAVDVTRFEGLVDSAHGLPPDRAVPVLRDALALWRGDALADLQSVAFARDEATRLAELRLSATGHLLDAVLQTGAVESVIAEARAFVLAHPFHEHGWQILMLALYRAGRQSDAIAAAAELRSMLVAELGLDPSPGTRELEGRILRHDPALLARPAGPPPRDASPPASAGPALVGRADALAVLDDAVAAAGGGRGRLLVLDAPAGLGKSTMLQALADRVRAADGVVVRGGGVGAGPTPALWPWVTIVRELSGHLPAGSPDGTSATAALALLDGRGDGDAALSRTTLYRGVLDLLAAVAGVRRLAVLLDDAHGVDADTLTLLALAVDELVDRGVLFGVAVRAGEAGTAGVREVLGRIRRELVGGIALPILDGAAVAELVRALSGTDPGAEVSAMISARTAGNPLFVGELVRLLTSERRLDAAGVGSALPEHVRDVLRRRLERLPGQTVALLTIVAVAGGPADAELLAAVTGLDGDAVLDSCESALLAGLLVEGDGGFALSHDLVRQTLDQDLSGARRVRLHAKLATALQARGPLSAQEVLDVARHLVAAAPIVGPGAAVPFLLTASDDALSRYAHDRSEQLLLDALALASTVRDPGERATLEANVRGKLVAVRTWSRGVLAEPVVYTAATLPPPTDSATTSGWVGALIMDSVGGDYARAADTADRALAGGLPPEGRVGAHFVIGWADYLRGRIDDADHHLRALEDLLAGDPTLHVTGMISAIEVSAAGYASLIAHVRGDDAAADRALALAQARVHSEPDQINVELHHAWLGALRGDAGHARQHAGACLALADRISSPVFQLHACVLAAWADALLGDPAAAARTDAAAARYRASGMRLGEPLYLLLRAEAHAVTGDPTRAAELVGEYAAVSAEVGEVCLGPRLIALSNRVQGTSKP